MFGRSSFFKEFQNDPFFNPGMQGGMEDPFSHMDKQFADATKLFSDMEHNFLSMPFLEAAPSNRRHHNTRRGELMPAESSKLPAIEDAVPAASKALDRPSNRRRAEVQPGFGDLFGGMQRMMADMHKQMQDAQELASQPNFDGQSYVSSTFQSYKSNGREAGEQPTVYQAHSSTSTGPGGLKETRRAVHDSRTGEKRVEVGRHLGDRAHIMERKYDARKAEQLENHHYRGIGNDEETRFDSEWQARAAENGRRWSRPAGGMDALGAGQRKINRKALLSEHAKDV